MGFALLGTVTGIGGGTIRDILLGAQPVFWIKQPAYLVACVVVAVVTFFIAHIPQSRERVLLWFDAVGLSLFCVTGAESALAFGASAPVAIAMGVASDLRWDYPGCSGRRESHHPQTGGLHHSRRAGLRSIRHPDRARLQQGLGRHNNLPLGPFSARSCSIRGTLSLPRYRRQAGASDDSVYGRQAAIEKLAYRIDLEGGPPN